MKNALRLPQIPASRFGMVLGLAGLGNSWRIAHRLWGLPALVGECILLIAAVAWIVLMTLFGLKWAVFRKSARAELSHSIQSTYISLVGVATNLIAIGVYPYARGAAMILFVPATAMSLTHGVFFTSFAWRGERHFSETTGGLYLPTVAGCFVSGTAAATLGFNGLAQLTFGAGMLSWFSIESVILHRLYTQEQMPPEQRPSLGIQFAPAAVGAVTYLSITGGRADVFSRALLGYGVLQGLVLVRLSRWIAAHPLNVSYWAFTFGSASLSTAALRMSEMGERGVIQRLAPLLFGVANVVVVSVSIVTLIELAKKFAAITPTAFDGKERP